MSKFYVVWEGRETGIFRSWDQCKELVENFPGAKYKAFPTLEKATEAFRGNPKDHLAVFRGLAERSLRPMPEITNALAVDGACSGNPGVFEYQGVHLPSGQQMFHFGPMDGGTNNIAEFLAIVHALAHLHNINRPDIPIYSDSRTALAWVRNQKAKTTLPVNDRTRPVYNLIARAEAWLHAHPNYQNRLIKWDTDQWGEIPADFGRK